MSYPRRYDDYGGYDRRGFKGRDDEYTGQGDGRRDRRYDDYRGQRDDYRGQRDDYRGQRDGYRGQRDDYRGHSDGYRGHNDGYRGGRGGRDRGSFGGGWGDDRWGRDRQRGGGEGGRGGRGGGGRGFNNRGGGGGGGMRGRSRGAGGPRRGMKRPGGDRGSGPPAKVANEDNWIEADQHPLMEYEFMEAKPEKFEEEWLFVVCPVGKRRVLVAAKETSQMYTREGKALPKFNTCLPSGNDHYTDVHKFEDLTILDTILDTDKKKFYIVDMMHWKHYPYYDTEADFRSFCLTEKFSHLKNPSELTPSNEYSLELLAKLPCSQSAIEEALQKSKESSMEVDGILFIHKQSLYDTRDSTGSLWVRVDTAQEILGIQAPEGLEFVASNPEDERKKKEMEQRKKVQEQRQAVTEAAQEGKEGAEGDGGDAGEAQAAPAQEGEAVDTQEGAGAEEQYDNNTYEAGGNYDGYSTAEAGGETGAYNQAADGDGEYSYTAEAGGGEYSYTAEAGDGEYSYTAEAGGEEYSYTAEAGDGYGAGGEGDEYPDGAATGEDVALQGGSSDFF